MKYRCSHCSHVFELQDREFRRCPNCFWTTSIIPLEGEKSGSEQISLPPTTLETPAQAPARKKRPKAYVIPLAAVVLIGVLVFVFLKTGIPIPKFSLAAKSGAAQKKEGQPPTPKPPAKSKHGRPPESFLNQEELAQLKKPLRLTIPRALSSDEEEILKKQVSSPSQAFDKPALLMWKKEDFEKMLKSEQEKRKIRLGWSYSKNLVDMFEKHYPAALEAFGNGNYVLARDEFLRALAFRTFRNDPKRHRAVALVMLRPYINDVMGKIAVLNQYLLRQKMLTEVQSVYAAYQALFPVMELQEWDRAIQMIADVKKQIAGFENRPQDSLVDYSSAFNELDIEVQSAIRSEAAPKPESAVNLKPITIDLDLKEGIVRQNTTDELIKVQKKCEEVSQLIEEKNWEEVRGVLGSIEFPPELAGEAREKLALIEKMAALKEAAEPRK